MTDTNDKPPPFIAIGNDQLGDEVTDTADCPNCGEQHPIAYGTDEHGRPTRTLGFVRCDGRSYIVAVNGRVWRRR